MNGLTLIAMIALAIGVLVAYRTGVLRGRRESQGAAALGPVAGHAGVQERPQDEVVPASVAAPSPSPAVEATAGASRDLDGLAAERARLLRSYESDRSAGERARVSLQAEHCQFAQLAEERNALLAALAEARGETARYRQLLVDLENDTASFVLGGPGSPDDLKLIVGVGPVLERMLQQLGITTFRQIARWTERDIDDFEARLPEFPGRIRRDAWVTQAHALHQSKYGETLPPARAR